MCADKAGPMRAPGDDREASCSDQRLVHGLMIIALVAVIGALSPVPYLTSYGTWVAILAYVVLAVGNLAST